MDCLDPTPGRNVIPPVNHRLSIVIWVQIILSCLQGWTSESVAEWEVLIGYRLEKAYHYKCTGSQNEHEFVIYEFSNEKPDKLDLRADRWVGERKAIPGTTSELDSEFDVSSMNSSYTCSVESSLSPSFSVTSMKEVLTRLSGSLKQAACRLSDSSLPHPSAISSGHWLASDTIVRINGHPKNCEVMKVLTFDDDRAYWLSLWDIMVLIHVVHNDSTTYTLMEHQCYWFADTTFGLLERWSTEHRNGAAAVTTEGRRKWWRSKRAQPPTGNLWNIPVHHRDDVYMLGLWNKYMSERRDMNNQREGYEQRRTELLQKAEMSDGLTREVARYQERERRLLEEQAEKERRLKEEREEWERQSKEEQGKREHRLREQLRAEQLEKERSLEARLRDEESKRERKLREKYEKQIQGLKIRLEEEQEMNERRFQELTNMVRSHTYHERVGAALSQPVRPPSRS